MKTTTLAKLREHKACKPSYDLIAAHAGEDFEGEITLEKALEVLSLKDCIWALRTLEGGAEIAVEFAIRVVYPLGSVVWKVWADKWLSGEDRSKESARAAQNDAAYIARVTSYAARATSYAATNARLAHHAAVHAFNAANHASYAATATAKDEPAEIARQTEILKELLE